MPKISKEHQHNARFVEKITSLVHFPYNPLKCVIQSHASDYWPKESTLTEYMTEQEQIEQLKKWLKQNGLTILAGVALALITVSGWHYWQRYHTKVLTHASGIYDEMLTLRAQNDTNGTVIQAKRLLSHYPNTPYAQIAAFMLARDAANSQHYPEAIKQLTWVIDNSDTSSLRQIAKIRLARVLIAEKKPDDALETLKKIDDKSFAGLIDETKGDAYFSMKNNNKAHEFYQLALNELPKEEAAQRPLLQMKLDNVATTGDTTS